MPETLGEKKKPRLLLKYRYVCALCGEVEEFPVGLICRTCGRTVTAGQKKTPTRGDAGRGHKETNYTNLAFDLTAREDAVPKL